MPVSSCLFLSPLHSVQFLQLFLSTQFVRFRESSHPVQSVPIVDISRILNTIPGWTKHLQFRQSTHDSQSVQLLHLTQSANHKSWIVERISKRRETYPCSRCSCCSLDGLM
ncbi:hypothetical protein CC80DRAFT_318327 [Byssothecium circinans]|uniref:Uncharacterized protein n=1 Tax=Byssothecium circinans TaxID=147558 RepID=A0A6A5THB1_9PLEO|nr:hypothetical protein CC80DRAFT_329595 [Byssothecium circinans]KAF1948287.1 hypothetical protein CC80DRAFT_318327 [Byssothecium circinans]